MVIIISACGVLWWCVQVLLVWGARPACWCGVGDRETVLSEERHGAAFWMGELLVFSTEIISFLSNKSSPCSYLMISPPLFSHVIQVLSVSTGCAARKHPIFSFCWEFSDWWWKLTKSGLVGRFEKSGGNILKINWKIWKSWANPRNGLPLHFRGINKKK